MQYSKSILKAVVGDIMQQDLLAIKLVLMVIDSWYVHLLMLIDSIKSGDLPLTPKLMNISASGKSNVKVA